LRLLRQKSHGRHRGPLRGRLGLRPRGVRARARVPPRRRGPLELLRDGEHPVPHPRRRPTARPSGRGRGGFDLPRAPPRGRGGRGRGGLGPRGRPPDDARRGSAVDGAASKRAGHDARRLLRRRLLRLFRARPGGGGGLQARDVLRGRGRRRQLQGRGHRPPLALPPERHQLLSVGPPAPGGLLRAPGGRLRPAGGDPRDPVRGALAADVLALRGHGPARRGTRFRARPSARAGRALPRRPTRRTRPPPRRPRRTSSRPRTRTRTSPGSSSACSS